MTQAQSSESGSAGSPLRVLESVSIRPTTNPYVKQLVEALRADPGVELSLFGVRHALFGGYDVFHVHWPEVLFTRDKRSSHLYRRLITTALLIRLRLTRTPVVRTWHNTDRPDGLSRWDHLMLDEFDRRTAIRIVLNAQSEPPEDAPAALIPHGHYREWFARFPSSRTVPGRVAYVGLIRRYKGVEQLVRAFRDVRRPSASLTVSGKPSSTELADTVTAIADGDDRITLSFEFLEDPDFAREITAAQLVALPYAHMHNSGTALAALSLGRPVLVPENPVNLALSEEVGPGWVHTFVGELSGAAIDRTLEFLDTTPPVGLPDLGARDWDSAARQHIEAFRRAVDLR